MNKFYLKLCSVTLALSLTNVILLNAQVTIGSAEKPLSGTLLDLKQGSNTDGTTYSTKGLGLPRVNLTKLVPKTEEELSGSIGSTGNWSLTEHIGLLVYNVNEDFCTNDGYIYRGAYVWNGTKWELLQDVNNSNNETLGPEVYRFTDERDGQSYLAREFGDAGHWMLENLAYAPKNNDPGFEDYIWDLSPAADAKDYCYPGEVGSMFEQGVIPNTWKKEYGVLYSWEAATNGENTALVEQGQPDPSGTLIQSSEVEQLFGKIRGVCPKGWHLPSDREWNELEKEIYNNMSKYSCFTTDNKLTPSLWDPAWEWGSTDKNGLVGIGKGWRGSITKFPEGWTDRNIQGMIAGHGNAMKSPFPPEGNRALIHDVPEQKPYGNSLTAAQGGFAVILVGSAIGTTNSNGSPFSSYGRGAEYWTSSRAQVWNQTSESAKSSYIWVRMFSGSMSSVSRTETSHSIIKNPVRCKKD